MSTNEGIAGEVLIGLNLLPTVFQGPSVFNLGEQPPPVSDQYKAVNVSWQPSYRMYIIFTRAPFYCMASGIRYSGEAYTPQLLDPHRHVLFSDTGCWMDSPSARRARISSLEAS